MCRYNYSISRCANSNIDAFNCIGERNCSISAILKVGDIKDNTAPMLGTDFYSRSRSVGKKHSD